MSDDKKGKNYTLRFFVTLVMVVAAVNLFYAYTYYTKKQREAATAVEGVAEKQSPAKEKKVKYWVAPMDPTYISDKPGKSPMGMDLVPVYEEEDDDTGGIKISSAVVQNIGVKTEKAVVREISRTLRAVGRITYDERRVFHVQSKTKGWVEKLYVDFTGQSVKRGDYLLEIYSPELVATQEEFILALNYRDKLAGSSFGDVAKGGEALLDSSRRRLELFDVPEHQIADIEKTRKIMKTLHIHSPASGYVVEKNVVEGMQVTLGMTLYTIADLSSVWVLADIYEYEIPWISKGASAVMRLPSYPGKLFHGKVTYIYPYLERKTRTVEVRMEFENPGLALKPDMFADVEIRSDVKRKGVTVPTEAVIRSGSRNVVIVAKGEGRFAAREVTLGVEGDGYLEILKGLGEGTTVVTSANFLLDSESNLKEAVSKMLDSGQKADMPKMDGGGSETGEAVPMGEMDNSGHGGMEPMDHGSMGKSGVTPTNHSMDHMEEPPPPVDHSKMDHSSHGGMEHMDHGSMGKSGATPMNHSMDHGGETTSPRKHGGGE